MPFINTDWVTNPQGEEALRGRLMMLRGKNPPRATDLHAGDGRG